MNAKKYDPRQIYEQNRNPREDLGYTRGQNVQPLKPNIPWSEGLIKKTKFISPRESPLKEWWLAMEKEKCAKKMDGAL